MGKDSGTKCSLCGMNGHNSRTCATEKTVEFKLFGVKISEVITTSSDKKQRDDLIKKSVSMGNLQAHRHGVDDDDDDGDMDMHRGYLSDSHVRSKKDGHERKKGVPWTMEEHRTFLKGLEKLGKGDWRGISKNFVTTRTPTQVASHAQKYFLRKAAANKKKRRASLFDMSFKEEGETSESDPMETDKFPQQVARLQTTGPSVQIPNPVASHGTPTPPALSSMLMSRAQSIPNFSGIPYMVGAPGAHMSYMKSEGYSAVPVVPVMNMGNVGYPYHPKHQNSFTACTPFAPHQLYNNPFSAYYFPRVEPHSSSQVNTDLKLNNTAAPDVGDRAKLPTHTSNMNGAIGVI